MTEELKAEIEELKAEIEQLKEKLKIAESQKSYYLRNKEKLNRENADRRWYCDVCKKEYASGARYAHLQSKIHRRLAEGHETATMPHADVKNPMYCELCDIHTNDKVWYMHEKTKRHVELAMKRDLELAIRKEPSS